MRLDLTTGLRCRERTSDAPLLMGLLCLPNTASGRGRSHDVTTLRKKARFATPCGTRLPRQPVAFGGSAVGGTISDDQRLVFVGGLHRSGTSLLARLIAAHPDASGLRNTGAPEDEGQHIQHVYPTAEQRGGVGRFALNQRSHLTDESPLASGAAAQELWDSWSPFWDTKATYLVEKSPPNLVMG